MFTELSLTQKPVKHWTSSCGHVWLIYTSKKGTNFPCNLTQEFEKRMGIHPRVFDTIASRVEWAGKRFNQTLKQVHHVIFGKSHVQGYKNTVHFVGHRSPPTATTRVTPFQFVIWTKPEGPLSILETLGGRRRWFAVGYYSVFFYMEKLKKRLRRTQLKKQIDFNIQQKEWPSFHLRSTRKPLNPGDSPEVERLFEGEEEFGDLANTPLKEDLLLAGSKIRTLT
ncbi:hypothetical protein HNY73_017319 [Argiope bruennichi]|uniref:Uncharacterized protein n=1 Tax=Argiope bruennichi TaxID=94029 RepID=A0A8T0EQ80_ARGBR|nr:hypothetical protein HNY73_017319 [Argiope bruennichi]